MHRLAVLEIGNSFFRVSSYLGAVSPAYRLGSKSGYGRMPAERQPHGAGTRLRTVKCNCSDNTAELFRQKITDSITMAAYGRFWYGVRLADFNVGAPITNSVGRLRGGGASRVNNGAPVGARMYPVSTMMSVCDGAPSGSSFWRTSTKKYLCFVSANNEWTCGASN
jgi:hypothetical protein